MAAKANFSAYHNYVTDSLHQWDLNQVLTLWGLNLATVPEVHFSNKNMDRAIVRQATMENHVVTVNIPNSLLQHPLRIYAHIGIYVGSSFTVVETVEIPVIPRVRPLDYQIEDSDGEVYSFNQLENAMANMATKDQLANIVASVTTDTELIDVRYGADGKTYPSAGEAVRTPLSDALKRLGNVETEVIHHDYAAIETNAVYTGFIDSTGTAQPTLSWLLSDFISVNAACTIDYTLRGSLGSNLISYYDKDKNYIGGVEAEVSANITAENVVPPEGAFYLRYNAVKTDTVQYFTITKKRVDALEIEQKRREKENPLHQKIMTATGDSITATATMRPYASYARMIAAKNGMEYETKAIWGATLARGVEGSSGCILDTLTTMRQDADYIILSGGANDFYHLSSGAEQIGEITAGYTTALDGTTFCGAVELLCKTAIERWPGKKILYVITHRMVDIADQTGLQNNVAALREILEKWGIPYVDLWHDMPSLMLPALKNTYTSMGNTEYNGTGDGLHPNEDGYKLYYVPRVEAKLRAI